MKNKAKTQKELRAKRDQDLQKAWQDWVIANGEILERYNLAEVKANDDFLKALNKLINARIEAAKVAIEMKVEEEYDNHYKCGMSEDKINARYKKELSKLKGEKRWQRLTANLD